MLLPFRRSSRSAHKGASSLAQRDWEVDAILSTLSPVVRDLLRPWLLQPTDPRRWPPPEMFSERRWPISPAEADDQTRPTARKLLHDELTAMRQTLDLPPDALSGLTRNGLLAAHGRGCARWNAGSGPSTPPARSSA